MKIAALVLAAGAGRRIGTPKALLRLGSVSFLESCVERLRVPAIAEVLVVLGHEAERVRRETELLGELECVVNPEPDDGMLGSILCGLDLAERRGAEAVLIHPVDLPAVEPTTIRHVVDALLAGAIIAVPSHRERRGHPAGFARDAWPSLRSASPDHGARAVLRAHPEWVVHVEGDPLCVGGVNTRADYDDLVSRLPASNEERSER